MRSFFITPCFFLRQHFDQLVVARGLSELKKTDSKKEIAGRIKLLHEVIGRGLGVLLKESANKQPLPASDDDA